MKKELFEELVASIREAGRIRKGRMKPSRVFRYAPMDVKRIREKLNASQSQFAMMIGVSVSTLQNWEQGRRKPEGPSKALLTIVQMNPKAVIEALNA